MVTIYFDKQLFSYLFNAKEEKYIILRDKILSHKDDFVFLFSDAHLLDLQQDSTDIKYKEMDFMQSVVGENCLICEYCCSERIPSLGFQSFCKYTTIVLAG